MNIRRTKAAFILVYYLNIYVILFEEDFEISICIQTINIQLCSVEHEYIFKILKY